MQWPQGKERRVEDLKARYYTIARQLLVAREGGDAAVANHVLVKQPYNAQQERCALPWRLQSFSGCTDGLELAELATVCFVVSQVS